MKQQIDLMLLYLNNQENSDPLIRIGLLCKLFNICASHFPNTKSLRSQAFKEAAAFIP